MTDTETAFSPEGFIRQATANGEWRAASTAAPRDRSARRCGHQKIENRGAATGAESTSSCSHRDTPLLRDRTRAIPRHRSRPEARVLQRRFSESNRLLEW